MMNETPVTFTITPATADRWPDLERLFGPSGAYAGCWCMFWRLPRSQFKAQKYEGNKESLHHLLRQGEVPGLLAYADAEPVGWCGLGPREGYQALENSRLLKRLNEQPVWAITCFFVAKSHRQQGVMTQLLQAAVRYAKDQGATILEGYPIDIGEKVTSPGGYMGIAAAFRQVGFVEEAQVSETQRIMRYYLTPVPGTG